MVAAACKNPCARSVNFSISMVCPYVSGDGLCLRPYWQATETRTFGKQGGTGQTAPQEGLQHAHRIPVPLPGEGFVRRGTGSGGSGRRRRDSVGPRLRTRARRRAVRPRPSHMAAENLLHVPEGERRGRRIAVGFRSTHRIAHHPRRAGRHRRQRAHRGRTPGDHAFPCRLPGAGGTRHANVPLCAGPSVLRPAPTGHQPDQPGQLAGL